MKKLLSLSLMATVLLLGACTAKDNGESSFLNAVKGKSLYETGTSTVTATFSTDGRSMDVSGQKYNLESVLGGGLAGTYKHETIADFMGVTLIGNNSKASLIAGDVNMGEFDLK